MYSSFCFSHIKYLHSCAKGFVLQHIRKQDMYCFPYERLQAIAIIRDTNPIMQQHYRNRIVSVSGPSKRYDLPREIKAEAITAKTTSFMLLVTEKTRVSISVSSPQQAPLFRTQSCPSLLDSGALAQRTSGSRDAWFSMLEFLSSQCCCLSEKDHWLIWYNLTIMVTCFIDYDRNLFTNWT